MTLEITAPANTLPACYRRQNSNCWRMPRSTWDARASPPGSEHRSKASSSGWTAAWKCRHTLSLHWWMRSRKSRSGTSKVRFALAPETGPRLGLALAPARQDGGELRVDLAIDAVANRHCFLQVL